MVMEKFDTAATLLAIKECSFFSQFPDEVIQELLPHFEKITLQSNEVLLRQGDLPDYLYILLTGELSSYLTMEDGKKSKMGSIKPVETVGELGVITSEPRSLTVVAESECSLLQLSGSTFFEFCQLYPIVSVEILKLISKRAVKTIKLLHKNDLAKLVVIFPANQSIDLSKFKDKLKELENDTIMLLPNDFSSIDQIKQFIKEHTSTEKYYVIFIDSYHADYFHFFEEHKNRYYMVGDGSDQSAQIDKNAYEIIDKLSDADQLNLFLILLQNDTTKQPSHTINWLKKAKFHLHHHIRLGFEEDLKRFFRFATGNPIGLVCSGGGMRGFFHLGVLRALKESNIPLDMIGSVSAGSMFSSAFLLSSSMEKCMTIINTHVYYLKKLTSLTNFTWPIISLFSGAPFTDILEKACGPICIEDLWVPFFCISSNISLNKEVVHNTGYLYQAIRCSCAYPVAIPPVSINGMLYYDGGILNNLPTDVMRRLIGHKGKIIASHISHLKEDTHEYKFPMQIPFFQSLLYKLGLANKDFLFPPFFEGLSRVLIAASSYKEEINCLDANILIQPDLSKYPTFSLKKNQDKELVEMGYRDTLKRINKNKL